MPCLMTIRPGITTLNEAYYKLGAHVWVASSEDDFPSVVRQAVFFNATLPRTIIDWRWNITLPEWINEAQRGTLTVEDQEVLDVTIHTHLSLGEVMLAFGDPDESRFIISNNLLGEGFEYSAWYENERVLIRIEGVCPVRHYYDFPVRILFRPNAPDLSESMAKKSVCK